MTTPVWPDTLPRPERQSWQSQLQDARQKRQSEAGPPGYRRRFSSVARLIQLSVVLDRTQRTVFDQFYEETCAFGSSFFYMPDPTTDGWPLTTEAGEPLLTGAGEPLLASARWLCLWGDSVPVETIVGQIEFRKAFSIVVMP